MNWFNLRQDTNKLRTKFNQAIDKSTEKKKNRNINTNNSSSNSNNKDNSNNNEQVLKKKYKSNNFYRSKEPKNKPLETFIDTIEKQLLEPKNIKCVRSKEKN